MQKRKIVLCVVLVIALVFQSAAVLTVFSDSSASEAGICTLADFGTINGIKASKMESGTSFEASVEEVYYGSSTSLKINVKKGSSPTLSTTGINWSEYDYLRIRFYAQNTGDVVNTVAATNPTANLDYNPYMRTTFTVNKTGWQDVTLKLSEFTKNAKPLEEGGSNHTPAWSEMTALYLNFGGWSTAYTAGDILYLDEIWLEKSTHKYQTVTESLITESDLVIADVTSLDGAYTLGAGNFYPQTTNAREGGNGVYAMGNIPVKTQKNNFLYYDDENPIDLSAYKYVNLWLYNPRAINAGAMVTFYNGSGYSFSKIPALDWTGWKLVSLSIASNLTGIRRIAINANGWPSGGETGQHSARWYSAGSIGVEKVWFSKTAVTDPNAPIAPGTAESSYLADGGYMIKEFNSTASLKDAGGIALSNITASTSNNGLYGMTGHIKWDAAQDDDTDVSAFMFKGAGSQNQSGDEITNSKIAPETITQNGYNYINFLVYNPDVKTLNGEISQLNFVVLHGTAPDNSTFSGGYHRQVVTMDWTGRKVVSLALNSNVKTNGIYAVYVNAGGWSSSCVGWADIANFIDVDRIWLSKDAYSENSITNESVPNGEGDVSVFLDGTNTLSYTFKNSVSESETDDIVIYKDYEIINPSEYSVALDGKTVNITFSEALTEQTTYRIKFPRGMRDSYGGLLASNQIRSFTTESIFVNSDVLTVDGDKISGFEGMTLAEVKDSLNYTPGAELIFKSGDSVIEDESTIAKEGMTVAISKNDITVQYFLDCPMAEIKDIKYYMNGTETTNAFVAGTLEVKGTAVCYNKTKSAPVSLILAQYEDGKLAEFNYTETEVSGSAEISTSVTLEKIEGTTLSILKWGDFELARPIDTPTRLDIGSYLWMPSVFASGAVMQRDTELNLWGEAAPGSDVTVTLDFKSYNATAGADGTWSLTADPISVEENPHTMTVTTTGGGSLEFTNILAGEVWLCAGQSNMEWQMKRVAGEAADSAVKAQAKADIANSANSNIRFYNQSRNGTAEELKDTVDGAWLECNSTNVNNFSAVGYYFGKELEADLGVPVGLISAAYGGATIQAFMDSQTLEDNNISFTHSTDPMRHGGYLYNAMVAPIVPYNIKGVIWYQGCANATKGADTVYLNYQKQWAEGWRSLWGNETMPFIITQLAAYNSANYELVREAQYQFAEGDENVDMAVILEAGEKSQIHPGDKMTVGHRLALAAKGSVYNMENVQYKYAKPTSFTVDGVNLTITFDNVYDGLELIDGDTALNGFEILTSDGTWVSASASISGTNTVTVTDSTNVPVGVRAGFTGFPEPMYNLYNSANLLATPFRLTE